MSETPSWGQIWQRARFLAHMQLREVRRWFRRRRFWWRRRTAARRERIARHDEMANWNDLLKSEPGRPIMYSGGVGGSGLVEVLSGSNYFIEEGADGDLHVKRTYRLGGVEVSEATYYAEKSQRGNQ